ncbi:MAG: hypothetical protein HQ581_16655 [Planctomycetes bacterium]|nr:hypothetical protein [Planctomycetota bacterium]
MTRFDHFLSSGLLRSSAMLIVCGLGFSATAEETDAPAKNLALGAKYVLSPGPTYIHCTDPDDTVQLTDGRTTDEYFWTQKGTVGWQRVQYATITVDLGRVEPIGDVAFRTAAGRAGVTWPASIRVLVSDEGKTYRDAGDLVAMDHQSSGPWPDGYAIRRLATGALNTRGRYVRFLVIPMPGGPYLFCDEVEVLRGPDTLLERQPAGPIVGDVGELFRHWRTRASLRVRHEADVAGVTAAIRDSDLNDEALRRRLFDRVAEVAKQWDPEAITVDDSFRAVIPLNENHAKLFGIQAELWRALGRPPLAAWGGCAWDPLDPYAPGPKSTVPVPVVHTMRGEYRSAVIHLANSTDAPMTVWVDPGLPKSEITVYEVPWTDTSEGKPIAAALREAPLTQRGWQVRLFPGLVRQVWFTLHVKNLPPGDHRSTVTITPEQGPAVKIPLQVYVYPLQFPERTTLWLGGWSYSNGAGSYGITEQNRKAFLRHLQDRFVNAPWANSGVLMKYRFADDGSVVLDTTEMDDWIGQWPDARAYLVFLSVAHYSGTIKSSLGGAAIGSPEFDARVGAWISAWVRHLKSKRIEPNRLGLLIHDEPHEGSDVAPMLAWARAIKKAEPEVLIWEDPTYRDPAKAPAELFEACDVLCPNRPMWLTRGKPFARFYRDQQAAGRTLQFYSCSGPAKLLDPYAYHRLQAWQCWATGATGSFFWAFGDNSGASSWNEYLVKAGPYTPLFLDDRTVTAGKHMEAIRESVEDYETLVMLRRAVDRAKATGRRDEVIDTAEALLQTAAAEVLEGIGPESLRWHAPKDRTRADAVRVKILESLVALRP